MSSNQFITSMTFRLLPNYCKKIGLGLFLLTVWPNFISGFIEGYNQSANSGEMSQPAEQTFLGITVFSEGFFELFSILSVVGLIIYALSKDKVFDEFLMKLRMEAMHLTFFLSVVLVLALLLFDLKSSISALYLIELQVLIFLIANKVKKVNNKPSAVDRYEQHN